VGEFFAGGGEGVKTGRGPKDLILGLLFFVRIFFEGRGEGDSREFVFEVVGEFFAVGGVVEKCLDVVERCSTT
jgi:hypothetical protein